MVEKIKHLIKELPLRMMYRFLAFEREKNGKKVIFIANLSKTPKQFTLPTEGSFTDGLTSQKVTLTKAQTHNFKPWQYLILTN